MDPTANLPEKQEIVLKNGESWTEVKVRDFFAGIRAAMQVSDPFPINFDDVWPMRWKHRKTAVAAFLKLGLDLNADFISDEYISGINSADLYAEGGINTSSAAAKLKGHPRQGFRLSVRAVEHIIGRSIPAVFEVYRKVFHEWFDEKETREKTEWKQIRDDGKEVRKTACAIYAAHGVKGREFADVTNGTYRGLFRRNAAQLKVDHDVPKRGNLRDHMPSLRLSATRLAEDVTGKVVDSQNIQGGPAITDVAYDVGDDLRAACVQILNKPRRSI